jgi:hypothetical protein
MSYQVTIEEVQNNIVVTPPNVNSVEVTTTAYPITISYNATVIEGGGMSDNGLPTGGSAGQILSKIDSQSYNAEWIDLPETDLTDYATKVYVNSQGFITASALTGLATETYVDDAIAAIPPSGITDIVQDTTPQLGGNLDVLSRSITTSVTNGNITLSPNGNGRVLTDKRVRITSGAVDAFQITDGTSTLEFSALDRSLAFNGTGQGVINTASGDLFLSAGGGSSRILLGTTVAVSNSSNAGFGVTTQSSSSNLTLSTNNGTTSGSISIAAGANGNITLAPNGSGRVSVTNATLTNAVINSQTFPTSGASVGRVLAVQSTGVLAWVTINSLGTGVYLTSVNDDTAPALGGNLDVNGKSIVSSSNGNIKITPNGTGRVEVSGNKLPGSAGTSGQILRTDGAGDTYWDDEQDITIINESQPQVADIGNQWFNPTTQILKVYTAAGWVQVTADDLQF